MMFLAASIVIAALIFDRAIVTAGNEIAKAIRERK